MARRSPEKQLTQKNWDDELRKDDAEKFRKADDTEMKNRVFRVAKRRLGRSTNETDADGDLSVNPVSVFSGFSLVTNKSSVPGATNAAPSKPTFSFGSGFSSQPFGSTMIGSSFDGSVTGANTAKPNDNKSFEFVTKLKELNEAVLKRITGQIESDKACILTPIFHNYEKYVKELEEKDKSAANSSSAKTYNATTAAATAAPFAFSSGAAKSAASTEIVGTNAASTISAASSQSTSTTLGLLSFNKPTTTFGSSSSTGFLSSNYRKW